MSWIPVFILLDCFFCGLSAWYTAERLTGTYSGWPQTDLPILAVPPKFEPWPKDLYPHARILAYVRTSTSTRRAQTLYFWDASPWASHNRKNVPPGGTVCSHTLVFAVCEDFVFLDTGSALVDLSDGMGVDVVRCLKRPSLTMLSQLLGASSDSSTALIDVLSLWWDPLETLALVCPWCSGVWW